MDGDMAKNKPHLHRPETITLNANVKTHASPTVGNAEKNEHFSFQNATVLQRNDPVAFIQIYPETIQN